MVFGKILLEKNRPYYIGCFYNNDGSVDDFKQLDKALDQVSDLCRNNPNTNIAVGGDFNAPGIDWEHFVTTAGCPRPGACNALLETFDGHDLEQLQLDPTHRDGNILDLFATNKPGLVKSCVDIPGISDHHAVVIDSNIKAHISKKPPRKKYLWNKVDWDKWKRRAKNFTHTYLYFQSERTTEENYRAIQTFFDKTLDHLPFKMSTVRYDLPWLTQDLKRKCKRKQRLYNKAKKSGKLKHKRAYQEAQKSLKKELRRAHWDYINNILLTSLEEGNAKPFYGYVKSRRTDQVGVPPLKQDGVLHTSAEKRCEIAAAQFKSVFTDDSTDPFKDMRLQGPSYPPIGKLNITDEGVKKLLEGVNTSKASGPDEIPCKLLKELATEIAPVIASFFRQSLETGKLPNPWHTAWITPVYKKGPRCDAENYRPVSLTCVMCKFMEHLICTHMRNHFDEHGILTELNHGFRKKHSCESQLMITTHDFLLRLDKKHQVDTLILDFSKAFDTVPHKRLLQKLELCGIHGEILNWIAVFLTERTQSVMIDGFRSAPDDVLSGVPQGTVLGPLLFLVHINDLPSVVDPTTAVRLFADDCLLYRSIHSVADHVQLQRDLDALVLWGNCWGMRFNAKKCHVLHLARTQSPPVRFYQINGIVLGVKQSATYLGVLISSDLGWKVHTSDLAHKAHQRLGFARRNLRGAPFKYRELAYTSLVRPLMEYCDTVWDPTVKDYSDKLERVQRKAARWAKGQPYRRDNHKYDETSVTQLLKELNWMELKDRRQKHRETLLYKILNNLIAIDDTIVDSSDKLKLIFNKRTQRKVNGVEKHHKQLKPLSASDTNSPLWRATAVRTVQTWNNLPASVAEAATLDIFKEQLWASPSP